MTWEVMGKVLCQSARGFKGDDEELVCVCVRVHTCVFVCVFVTV